MRCGIRHAIAALAVLASGAAAVAMGQAAAQASLFVCGEDQKVSASLSLRWDVVVLAGDTRGYTPCRNAGDPIHDPDHRERREAAVIEAAGRSADRELRRLYALVTGWMGSPTAVGTPGQSLIPGPLLDAVFKDPVPRVRRQAAHAIGDVLVAAPGEFERTRPGRNLVELTRLTLQQQITRESDADVAATMLEAIARFPYEDDATREDVERFLVEQARGDSTRMLGAVKGLELLIRQNPKRPLRDDTRQRLRELVFTGATHTPVPTRGGGDSAPLTGDADNQARIRRLAMLALQAARDDEPALLARAASDADWQVRRLVALRLDFDRPEHASIGEALEDDPDFHVRYDLLAAAGRHAARTRNCAAVARRLSDPSTIVVLRALDLLPADCRDPDRTVRQLTTWAESLRQPGSIERWHVPARALVALARINPDAARGLLDAAVSHSVWQVRSAAAAAAATLEDEAVLIDLVRGDREPNVRTAALEGLQRTASGALFPQAIGALDAGDYQLLRAAALALKGAPAELREAAGQALLAALRRVTEAASDTSRDPRVAILQRLPELLAAERASELLPYRSDFDPRVRDAATKAFEALTNAPAPPPASVQRRYPDQPTQKALASLPTHAVIRMDHGVMELELFPDQAPVTVARFAALARAGQYNDRTFHRMAPNFVIQGGSPGANEYSGASRYMRDETGLQPHLRGSVGISTRGRDTGDAQFFIDLVDLPRLDHEYTVFGRVVAGYDVLDRILEGARIRSVSVK